MAAVPSIGFWTADDVAAFLKVSSAWVWKQVRANTGFPFVKLGTRNYRFDPAKVRAWVDRQSSEDRP
ncbi:AlpA family transcriptional regulator [Corallococcus sp. CA047B]|uniref:helix-turn-helix transcriptional regulator n=1 Tax=Corallococcus sp. CA047B TaxID=2316729 RepID=UPI001F3FEABE|nr:helix-turn-helix domain-containing protein [Corallococcus sp. CA047B]